MQPLRETNHPTSAIEAEAIDLLRSARPYEPPLGQKQRVRARLLQQGAARTRGNGLVLRPVVVLLVLLFAGGAGATAGRRWLVVTYQSLIQSSATYEPTRGWQKSVHRSGKTKVPSFSPTVSKLDETADRALPVVHDAQPPLDEAGSRPLVAESDSAIVATRSRGGSARGLHARAGRPPADTSLVFNAMRLLRREGQPTQAAALLDEYLSRHPSGAMAEEALALSIEAAAARGDGRAKDLIRQYVARYPNGHFRGVVEAARTRLSP